MEPAAHEKRSPVPLLAVLALISGTLVAVVLWSLDQTGPPDPPAVEAAAPARPRAKARAESEGGVVEAAPGPRASPPAGARNLVLVILTAARRDALSPYGAPAVDTPVIGALAASGARFDDALAASPFARTSGIALLTGQHAAALGAVEPGPQGENRPLPAEVDTLAERLRAGGWATYGIAANFNYNTESGLAQGFDRFHDAPANSFAAARRRAAPDVVRDALALVADRGALADHPFYLQVELLDAHPPWRTAGSETDGAASAIRAVDAAVGSLLAGLAAANHRPDTDTYVVVLADHGSGNSDPPHHGKVPGRVLWPTSVRVPWIVAGPDVARGHVVRGLASGTDLAPTALDLLGLPPLRGVDGRSWAALLRGEGDRTTRERAFSDTWQFNVSRASIWTASTQCQKDYGSVNTVDAFPTACFDRERDPTFASPVADDALFAELDAWRAAAKVARP